MRASAGRGRRSRGRAPRPALHGILERQGEVRDDAERAPRGQAPRGVFAFGGSAVWSRARVRTRLPMSADPSMVAAVPPLTRTGRVRTWASFVRFEHTLFSLPLLLAGIFCVPGPPMSFARWVGIAVAAVGARTAAMSLNRIIDRRLDALNPRTRGRELPA